MRILRKKEVIAMQMYEVTALAPEGPEEVYQAMVFAEDEDDALNQLEEQLKELDGFSDNLMDILDAIGKGISFQEIEWEYRDGHVVVGNIEYVHQKKFIMIP